MNTHSLSVSLSLIIVSQILLRSPSRVHYSPIYIASFSPVLSTRSFLDIRLPYSVVSARLLLIRFTLVPLVLRGNNETLGMKKYL